MTAPMLPWPELSLMVKQVRWFAETMPDTVNEECRYVDAVGQPSCIIGHALVALGYTTDWQASAQLERRVDVVNETSMASMLPDIGYPGASEDPRVQWLMDVQDHQDGQHPWREAVEEADERWGHIE